MRHMRGGLTEDEINYLKKEKDCLLFGLPKRIADRIETPVLMCGCWTVNGWDDGKGYKKLKVKGKAHYVHRVVFELKVGPFPFGLVLHHLCYNRSCCNPLHLVPESNEFNVKDGSAILFKKKEEYVDPVDKEESERLKKLHIEGVWDV